MDVRTVTILYITNNITAIDLRLVLAFSDFFPTGTLRTFHIYLDGDETTLKFSQKLNSKIFYCRHNIHTAIK